MTFVIIKYISLLYLYIMKPNSDHIIFEVEGRIYKSWPEIEQQIFREMRANHKPESIVKCWEWYYFELLDELTLEDLFGN